MKEEIEEKGRRRKRRRLVNGSPSRRLLPKRNLPSLPSQRPFFISHTKKPFLFFSLSLRLVRTNHRGRCKWGEARKGKTSDFFHLGEPEKAVSLPHLLLFPPFPYNRGREPKGKKPNENPSITFTKNRLRFFPSSSIS